MMLLSFLELTLAIGVMCDACTMSQTRWCSTVMDVIVNSVVSALHTRSFLFTIANHLVFDHLRVDLRRLNVVHGSYLADQVID